MTASAWSPRAFCVQLGLDGWSDRSLFGYDEQTITWFAQLWPDAEADASTDPTIWISGIPLPINSFCELVVLIADATGHSRNQVAKVAQAAVTTREWHAHQIAQGGYGPPVTTLTAAPGQTACLIQNAATEQYLAVYYPEAYGGLGFADWTDNERHALRFVDSFAAQEAYLAVPRNCPLREDGQPNRPLAGNTVELVWVTK